jgi:DNA-binding NarL/FixJ family response regulator
MNTASELGQKHLVYVVEPHPVAADYLATALTRNPALEVILSSVNLPSDAALSNKSSVLIVDADALPLPLVPYLCTVRTVFRDAQILVIGKGVSDDELCRLLFQGVSGYVNYERIEAEICKALDAVFGGGVWASPAVLQRYVRLSSAGAGHEPSPHGALSPREKEIGGLLQRRLCNKEISGALGISERTVRFHIENIFDKLGVRDRYSVMELLRTAGLAGPEKAEKTDQRAHQRKRAGPQVLRQAA